MKTYNFISSFPEAALIKSENVLSVSLPSSEDDIIRLSLDLCEYKHVMDLVGKSVDFNVSVLSDSADTRSGEVFSVKYKDALVENVYADALWHDFPLAVRVTLRCKKYTIVSTTHRLKTDEFGGNAEPKVD